MSKETSKDDVRQRTDWGSGAQTDKPWKGNPEKSSNRAQGNLILIFGKRPTHIEGTTDSRRGCLKNAMLFDSIESRRYPRTSAWSGVAFAPQSRPS